MRYKSQLKIFAWGLTISFLGSLPLGPLNLIVTYLSASRGIIAAFTFCVGCIVSELIFVRILLVSLNWVKKKQQLFKLLEWTTIAIILIMAIYSFTAAIKQTGISSPFPTTIHYPLLAGILISTLDPMKIPFWFLWSTWLIGNNVLEHTNVSSRLYLAGIGLGSLLGFVIFILGGKYLVKSFSSYQDLINWAIGSILIATVFVQIYRIMQKKAN